MKTSIATVSLSGDLREKLDAISKAGFDGIEIFEQDFISFDLNPTDVKNMVSDHGLEITLFQPFRDFEGLPEGILRQRAFSRAQHKFDLMVELGTDLMLVCSSLHPAGLGGIDRCADDFSALGDIAKQYGVRVGYEALAWGKFINDHRDAWEVVRRAGHSHIGLILDSFHTLGRRIDPNSIRVIPGDKIFFVQLADAPAIDMDLLYWSRHFRNMPGEGDLDLNGFMDAVYATGYDGPLSLEIFNDQFRRGDAKMVAQDGHRSLIYLMDEVRRRTDRPLKSLPALPNNVVTTAVHYVEFACASVSAQTLGVLLSKMGFVNVGQHKSKDVSRYQSGEVNILLNSDQQSRLYKTACEHGVVVSEIAFVVDDASAAFKRAIMLGAECITLPADSSESEFPAIRGGADSLIRFVDSELDLWGSNFNVISSTSTKPGTIRAIDHIAQTMGYDEMLSWTLFFTTIFEMHKSTMVDVIDPDGVVKSQVVSTYDHSVQLTLNGSDATRTSAHQFASGGHGGSVQHLAFATDDVVSLAREFRRLGFQILPQTENYYADISARFDLPETELALLRKFNILYDEDETGTALHFYSTNFGNGLFFEFIERRSGYRGFGAANAPFRLAAQRRISKLNNS